MGFFRHIVSPASWPRTAASLTSTSGPSTGPVSPRAVVYSRFGTKADIFLALLADRVAERAAQNAAAAGKLAGAGRSGMHELARRAEAAPGVSSPGAAEGHAALRQSPQKWGSGRQGEYENVTHLLRAGPGCTAIARELHGCGAVGRPARNAVDGLIG